MRLPTVILLILISCISETIGQSIDNISLLDIGQKLNGHWRLKEIESQNGQRRINLDTNKLEFYEFEGLKGVNSEITDNHDGSFGIALCFPFCNLKESGKRKKIVYTGLTDKWELEIIKLSDELLVLSDSKNKWTYERVKSKIPPKRTTRSLSD